MQCSVYNRRVCNFTKDIIRFGNCSANRSDHLFTNGTRNSSDMPFVEYLCLNVYPTGRAENNCQCPDDYTHSQYFAFKGIQVEYAFPSVMLFHYSPRISTRTRSPMVKSFMKFSHSDFLIVKQAAEPDHVSVSLQWTKAPPTT